MKTVRQLLVEAKALIEHPVHWTQHVYARDRAGGSVQAHDERAVCWCALGALYHVGHNAMPVRSGVEVVGAARDLLTLHSQRKGLPIGASRVNDYLGHAEVMKMYDAAIATATEKKQ